MTADQSELDGPRAPRRGTRWGRTTLVMVPAIGAMGAVLAMVSSNVLAASIVVQNGVADFSSSRVHGDTVALGMVTLPHSTGTGAPDTKPVLRAGFGGANINGFCLSQVQKIGTISYTVKVKGGDNNAATFETTGQNIVMDITSMRGTANPGVNLDGLVEIGNRSDSLHTIPDPANPANFLDNPLEAPSANGYIGIQASIGEMYSLRGKVYDLQIGGPLALPGLSISVVPGGSTCATDAIPN